MYRLLTHTLIVFIGALILSGCSSSNNETPLPSVTEVQVTPAFATVAVNTEGAMRVTAYFSDDSFLDVTTDATWTSSDVDVVQVDSVTGYAVALSAGTATLTAAYEGLSDTSNITVTASMLDSIDVTPSDDIVAIDIKLQYTATGNFSDGSQQDLTPFVSWNSMDTGVATIAEDGIATSVSSGTTIIDAAYNSVSGATTLEVTPATISFLKIVPAEETAVTGTRVFLIATAYFSDDSEQNVTYSSEWDSSNNNVASVNNFGYVSANSVGTTFITAIFEGITAYSYITVTEATLERIEIFPNSDVVPVGGTVQFNARGFYSDFTVQDLTNIATWKSSNDRVATVESGVYGGFTTAIGVGDTNIEVTFDRVTESAVLQVLGFQ